MNQVPASIVVCVQHLAMRPPTNAVCLAILALQAGPFLSRAENWPCWRGPRLDGTSHEKKVPLRWSGTSNVVWKTALPGAGHASPIVWDDRIFTVGAMSASQDRVLVCLDRTNGRIVWQQTVLNAPLERKHSLNSHASSTPATDGALVYVAFLDGDKTLVAAYDFNGRQRWLVRPGVGLGLL